MRHAAFRFDATCHVSLGHHGGHFHASARALQDAVLLLNLRRLGNERTLGVAVINHHGVETRLVSGTGPLALAVGRHAGCDLFLPHADASLRHLMVVADDDGCGVVDLSSSAGTAGETHAPRGGLVVVRTSDSVVVAAVVEADESFICFERAPPPRPRHRARLAKSATAKATLSLAAVAAPVLIGRGARNDIVVDNDNASRVHAVVMPVRHLGRYEALLVDVGSTNGTVVLQARDGRARERALGPARRAMVIRAGDHVVIAEETRFAVVGSVDSAAYATHRGAA